MTVNASSSEGMLNRKIRYGAMPSGNPLTNALMVIVGALVIGALVVLGIVAFLVVASIIVVLAGIIGIRVWWHNRKLRKGFEAGGRSAPGAGRDIEIIEGEYYTTPTRTERERKGD